ncbi:hypothetical protein [Deinococcus maricopensis]|uniref:Uncharacterized protein n=1 Tax=Deinococcus maricopensis (strain DSM 21211 / LMG 22137 / NRRL B-23946 / LB-34) TaxID=709986 RepID=E8U9L4_DEIML|nr:hypothetical protein [Deinococcus maricopensis]ADV67753.1 hypothetical protein Deima_2110 [Deinococcus maricopensis DSM 21211]
MSEVLFRNEKDGSPFEMVHPKAARVLQDVQAWADTNHFERIVFWRDADDAQRLWVQLGDDRLNYWMPDTVFSEGRHEDVEMQLDYARGAQRRSAAGYEKFDQ